MRSGQPGDKASRVLEQRLGCPGKAKNGRSRRGWRELAPSHQLPAKAEHYWESRPAEMSGPGSRGGGDGVKACSHPRGAEWRHWALSPCLQQLATTPASPRAEMAASRTGPVPTRAEPVLGCPAWPPGGWAAGQRPLPAPPARHWGIRKGLLALPKEAVVAGRRDGGLPCQGPAYPGGRQARGPNHSCPAPIPSTGLPQAVMSPGTPGIKAETLQGITPSPSPGHRTQVVRLDDSTCKPATQEAEAGGQPDWATVSPKPNRAI